MVDMHNARKGAKNGETQQKAFNENGKWMLKPPTFI